MPVPAFPGDVPPLPAARSAQDPGFHPDMVQKTQASGGTVTLTCLNPATNRTEVIVGRAGRDTVFALRDPQAADLPTSPVQSVAAGSLVASRDPATGRTGYGRVTATVSRPAPALVTLSLSDPSSGKVERLTCTPEHPLYVSGKGWAEAGDLGVGTSIVTRAGPPVVVKSVDWRRDETGSHPFTVYNLTVEGDHTYFAGGLEGGAWAHNVCVIGRNADKERFFQSQGRDGYKSYDPDPADFTVPKNREWITQNANQGEDFLLVTPEEELSNVRVPGEPNGYYTNLELQWLRAMGKGGSIIDVSGFRGTVY